MSRVKHAGRARCGARILFVRRFLPVVIALAALFGASEVKAQFQCFDEDGDGFFSPRSDPQCSELPPDCDDTNPNIFPEAPEQCNGLDDDCDRLIDEGFFAFARDGARACKGGDLEGQVCDDTSECPGGICSPSSETFDTFQELPIGSPCINGFGACLAYGTVVCPPPRSNVAALCDAVAGEPQREGPPGDPTCYDAIDNDCDGLVDHGSPDLDTKIQSACSGPELCDGKDNNNNGEVDEDFLNSLGNPCSIGIGLCKSTGKMVCSDDRFGTKCSAFILSPSKEGPPGSASCFDKKDNDCDRLIDFNDPDCRQAELCDGKDNDGDELIDEDFPDLGQFCTKGTGRCVSVGIRVCSADGSGTVCAAIPLLARAEGPRGITCRDEIDNDCDGFTDFNDPSCGSAEIGVRCALKPGVCRDCIGWYTIDFDITGAGSNPVVTAELLAINFNGDVVARLPVQKGDTAKLGALNYPDDCIVAESIGNRHQVFAPVPMLRIIVENGQSREVAYCSNTPYLDVIEPAGQVINVSEGEDVPVFAAIPLVDPRSLFVKVNGVDLFAALGINPSTAFPGGPYDGVVLINGKSVAVSDLLVRSAPLALLSSNTISMTLSGLGCGEHIIVIDGVERPGAQRTPRREACYVDDLRDKGTAIGFEINITTPTTNQVVGNHPLFINVLGTACHGRAITDLTINRFPAGPNGQTFTPGDGEDSGDVYNVVINVNVPVTDLRAVVDSGALVGTLDPGPNRLIAQAMDGDFNVTHDNVFFAVGPIIPAPTFAGSAVAGGPGEVERAFTFAITAEGLDKFFESHKERNKRDIGDRVRQRIKEFKKNFTPSIDGACDPPTIASIPTAEYENDTFGVKVDPQQDKVAVRINLPGIDKIIHLDGYCQVGCICAFGGCLCAACTDIDIDFQFKRTGMFVAFDVTEDRLENRTPLDISFNPGDTDNGFHLRGEVDIGCVLGFFLDVVDVIIFIVTFSLVDTNLDIISFDISGDDIKEKMSGLDGDPMDLDLVKMRNPDLSNFGTRQRESRISDAEITSQGIAIALASAFEPEPSEIDPGSQAFPGTPLKNAPLPEPPIFDAAGNPAGDVTIAISGDVFNQLLSSATRTGRLRTEFTITRTLGDFLPDCDDITNDRRRARCIGFRGGDSCDRFCRPLDGCEDVCEAEFPGVGNGDLRRTCCRARRIDRNNNIGIGTTLILHGRMHVPPQLLIDDDPATPDPVEVVLRSPQVSITLIADRDGDGNFDASSLDEIPACTFGDLEDESPTQSVDATMCKLWETCLAADMRFQLVLEDGPLGRPRIRFANGEIIRHDDQFGALCGGGIDVAELDFFNNEASRTQIFDILEERQRNNTPPLDSEGLELGGLMRFQRDRIIAIETQLPADDDGFQDYIGITGNIVPRE
ncbi:MAG: putative metal-binding motif-containing protein, partial [Planctomycetes bacterium]|nr:putative metal-binding motif-containing protein [Planctomycetota bacterium]